MVAISCEKNYTPHIDYDGSLWEAYYGNEGSIHKKTSFGYDASNQQWGEGEEFEVDLEEQIKELAYADEQRLFIPRQWTVELRKNGIVVVSLHLSMINIVDRKMESIQEKEWLIECDVAYSTVQAWPAGMLKDRTSGWVGAFSCNAGVTFPDMLGASCVDIPTAVTETAISYMQEVAEEEFGFKPTYMGNIHGMKHMIGFCMRPLDLNIHQFRHFVGRQYEELFPRNQHDNYRPLCRFFQIENPPKSLRKIYGESPESFVAYLLLRQLGFSDINVIRSFFHREKLFGWTLMEMSYMPEQFRLTRGRYLYEERIHWLERFCRWYLRYRSESSLANCLRPLAVADEWEQEAIDILRMFIGANVNGDDSVLHQETKRRLLREGFTRAVHDMMMEELPGILPRRNNRYVSTAPAPMKNTSINYTKAEKKYVDIREGYSIELPKDTDELRSYGKAFHNCVASYCDSVVEKRTLILAMKRGKKFIACLEVRQNRLVQAFGPCNQHLPMSVGEVLCRWADDKKIAYKVRKR